MAPAGNPASAGDRHGTDARTAASRPRPRACPHQAARLSGQPVSDRCRDAVLLSPRRLVDLEADPHRARALLRRYRRAVLWRPDRLRTRADDTGASATRRSLADDGG